MSAGTRLWGSSPQASGGAAGRWFGGLARRKGEAVCVRDVPDVPGRYGQERAGGDRARGNSFTRRMCCPFTFALTPGAAPVRLPALYEGVLTQMQLGWAGKVGGLQGDCFGLSTG